VRGVYTAIVTSFSKQDEVDLKIFEKLVSRQVEAGVQGIVVAGSTGEGACLRLPEWESLIECAVRTSAGKIDVMVSCGSSSTHESMEKAQRAESLGATSLLISSPAYNKPTQKGLLLHFEKIAKASSLPIMLYNIPGRTAVNIRAETIQELWKIPNIRSLKESSGDWAQYLEIQKNLPEGKSLLSGDDPLSLAMAAHGADGVVSVVSNVFPKTWCQFWKYSQEGQVVEARRILLSLIDFIQALFCESNPIPVKWAVAEKLGLELPPRLPLTPLSESSTARLKEELRRACELFPQEI
jgi:4-hydroxy-tetrahydrodipicolinate synthase